MVKKIISNFLTFVATKKVGNKFPPPLFFAAVGSGIRDPGSGINIPDPQHCPNLSLIVTRTAEIATFFFNEGHPSSARSLQPSKENIQFLKILNIIFSYFFVNHRCLSAFGSVPYYGFGTVVPIELESIQIKFRSATLPTSTRSC
jgi:hypothetical protein